MGALTAEAYIDSGLVEDEHLYLVTLRDAQARAAVAELWVAVAGDRVIATVTFCPPGSNYRETGRDGQGEFRNLAVDPGSQGRGVARALIDRCFERCADLGLPELVLCVDERNTSAQRLYERLGFVRRPDGDWSPIPTVRLWAYRAAV